MPDTGLEFSSSKLSFLIALDRFEGVPLLAALASVLARLFVPLEGDAKGVVGRDLARARRIDDIY